MALAGKASGSRVETYNLKEILKCFKKVDGEGSEKVTVTPPRRRPLEFDRYTARLSKDYAAYIYVGDQTGATQFVVVFNVDDPDKSIGDEAKQKYYTHATHIMEVSLGTLAVG